MHGITKQAMCEFAAIKFDLAMLKIASAAVWIGGVASDSTVLEMIGASLVGALLMGYAFARRTNPKDFKALGQRWSINLCFGVPLGLMAAYQWGDLFPKIPPWVLSGVFSGLAGPLMVLLIPIGIPFITGLVKLFLEIQKQKIASAIMPKPSDAPDTYSNSRDQEVARRNSEGQPGGSQQNAGLSNVPHGSVGPVEQKDSGSRRD